VPLTSRSSILRLLGAVAVASVAAGCAAAGAASPPSTSSPTAAIAPSAPAPPAATLPPTPPPTIAPTPDSTAVADGEPWIAYQGGTGGPPKIRLVRPDGTGDHMLAPGIKAGDQLHPDWSPDGRRIVFAADDDDGTRDLWTADADGSDPAKAFDCADTCPRSDDPAWAPDGRTLLFRRSSAGDTGPGRFGSTRPRAWSIGGTPKWRRVNLRGGRRKGHREPEKPGAGAGPGAFTGTASPPGMQSRVGPIDHRPTTEKGTRLLP